MRLALSLEGLAELIAAPFTGSVSFNVADGKIIGLTFSISNEDGEVIDLMHARIADLLGPFASYGPICN